MSDADEIKTEEEPKESIVPDQPEIPANLQDKMAELGLAEEPETPAEPSSVEKKSEPKAEEPVALTPADELEQMKQQNMALMAQLSSLAEAAMDRGLQQAPTEPTKEAAPAQAQQQQAQQVQQPLPVRPGVREKLDIVTKENFKDVFISPEGLNKILTEVYNIVRREHLAETTVIANNIAQQQISTHLAVEKFFDKNADLMQLRPVVTYVAAELGAKNPGWDVNTLLQNAGEETRRRVGMRVAQANAEATSPAPVKPTAKPSGRPVFAPGTGTRTKVVPPTGQAKHVQDILDTFGPAKFANR